MVATFCVYDLHLLLFYYTLCANIVLLQQVKNNFVCHF